jgi:hypothetical protein
MPPPNPLLPQKPPNSLPPNPQPQSPPLLLPKDKLTYLVRELAHGIRSRADILDTLGVTLEQFADLAVTPEFQTLLLDEKRKWLETANAKPRVRTKTTALLETIIETVSGDIIDPTLPLGPRTALLKVLANISGLEMGAQNDERYIPNSGNVFNLNIQYADGKGSETITIGERVLKKGNTDEDDPRSGRGQDSGNERARLREHAKRDDGNVTPYQPFTNEYKSTQYEQQHEVITDHPKWVEKPPTPSPAGITPTPYHPNPLLRGSSTLPLDSHYSGSKTPFFSPLSEPIEDDSDEYDPDDSDNLEDDDT